MILGIVAGMLRTFTDKQGAIRVKISPSFARRAGFVLLLIGIALATAGTDAIASSPASTLINYYGGGPSFLHCQDMTNLVCWLPGNSGASPTLINQTGTATCSTTTICTTPLVTFATPYTKTPVIGYSETFNPNTPSRTVTVPGATTSNLISFQSTPGNDTSLIYDDESLTTVTVPNVDTAIKSWNPSTNLPAYLGLIIEGEGYIKTTSMPASTQQDVSIKVEDVNAAVVLQTIKFNPESVVASGKIPFAIKALDTQSLAFGINVEISVQAPAADANTSVNLVSLRVYGLENGFKTWLSMPAASSEIYGNTNDEQQFSFLTTASTLFTFCVNVKAISGSATAYLTPYVAGVELSSNLRVLVGSNGLGVGLQCSTANISTITTGVKTVTVFGVGGAGAGDFPAFGAISLNWTQTNASSTITVPNAWSVAIIGLSPSSFQFSFRFFSAGSATVAITFTWWAIGV
jgi:hypothetical protein